MGRLMVFFQRNSMVVIVDLIITVIAAQNGPHRDCSKTVLNMRPALGIAARLGVQCYVVRTRPLTREFVEKALARGDVACGAMHRDRLVSYMWRTSTIAPHENGLWVRTRPPYHYGYKGFTHPEYRGQHINTAVSFASDAYFLERGFTHMVGFVDLRNAYGPARVTLHRNGRPGSSAPRAIPR